MKINNYLYDKKFEDNGKNYDLSHLKPFTINVKVRKTKTIDIEITFSTHVFSSEFKEGDNSVLKIEDSTRKENIHNRAFCKYRYKQSKQLKKILGCINNKTLLKQLTKDKFCISIDNYNIYFRLFISGIKVILHVESAYISNKKVIGKSTITITKWLLGKGF